MLRAAANLYRAWIFRPSPDLEDLGDLEKTSQEEHLAYENQRFRVVTLAPESREYREIESYFHRNTFNARFTVISIDKNTNRWAFNDTIRTLQREGTDYAEKTLFHGTRSALNHRSIFAQGFLLEKANNGLLGKGIYFADDVNYSDSGYCYTTVINGTRVKTILVCRVLLVSKRYKKMDNIQAIFDERFCFPEYLITYQ